MLKYAPYVLKTLWRHRARTVLTVSGAAVALFVFCCVGAVQQAMDDLGRSQQARQSLIVFQANKFCPATSHLPQDYSETIARLPGVRAVVPIQVFTNNCRASLNPVVYYGLLPKQVRRVRDFQLVAGDWGEFERNQDTAVVGRAIAARGITTPGLDIAGEPLHVGDKFTIGGMSVTVAGIFRSEDATEENYVYTHLEYLQRRQGKNEAGTVTQFEVLLEPDVDATAASERVDDALRGGPVETDTRPKGVFQAKSLGDLTQLIGLVHYLGYACLGLVLALVATTTLMSVQDRVKEHAVLQTLGFSSPRVFSLVLAESVLLSLAGGLAGVAAAMAVLHFREWSMGAEAVSIAFRASPRVAAIGIVVSLAAGLLAGLAPAWHAARTEIVPALRQG